MFFNRIVRAIQLDPQVYAEVGADKGAVGLAFGMIMVSSVATGIGGARGYPQKIPYLAAIAFGGWLLWIVLTYIIGAKLFPAPETQSDIGAVLRVAGLASAPGLIRLLAYLPPFTVIVSFGAILWTFGTTVIAMQQAFRYHNMPRAIAVTLFGYLIFQWIFFMA